MTAPAQPRPPDTPRDVLVRRIEEDYGPGVVLLDPPALDRAIAGFTATGPVRAVYTYDGLAEAFAAMAATDPDAGDPWTCAYEWLEQNTLRSIPYMGEQSPVVVGVPDWLATETTPKEDGHAS